MDNRSRMKEIREVLFRNHITRGVTPEKLRVILEELGPTYIKLGQIMSLHSDILPRAYCEELMKLNSEVTPMSFEEVEARCSARGFMTLWPGISASCTVW